MLTRGKAVFRRTGVANLTLRVTPLAHMAIIVETVYIFWGSGTTTVSVVSTAIMEFLDINFLHIAFLVYLAVAMAFQAFPLNGKTDMIFFSSGSN